MKLKYTTLHPHKSGKSAQNKYTKIMIIHNGLIKTLKYAQTYAAALKGCESFVVSAYPVTVCEPWGLQPSSTVSGF